MDGLSAAASVIAVIQLCGSVFNICRTYYTGVKDARKDITRLRSEVTRLESVLTSIADLADTDDSAKLSVLQTLAKPDGAISQCKDDLTDLLEILQAGCDREGMKRYGWRALSWPLKSKDVDKTITEIDRHKSLFHLALTADTATMNMALSKSLEGVSEKLTATQLEVQDTRTGVVTTLQIVKIMQDEATEEKKRALLQDVTKWLAHTSPVESHQAAYRKRQPGTGEWLTQGARFREWKRQDESLMWLRGIQPQGELQQGSQAVAYFYFEFNDTNKQSPQKCLAALVSQICNQTGEIPNRLEELYERHGRALSLPSALDLVSVLDAFAKVKKIKKIYIVIDALDECPKTGPENHRAELLGAIKAITAISPSSIHMLVTSRQEMDIEEELLPHLKFSPLSIHESGVTADIIQYVQSQLSSDPQLNTWSEDIKSEIEHVLTQRAGGMFRWVFCQLDALKRAKKKSSIRLALKQLPKTLDETYERMLLSIDEIYKVEAKRALLWLAFSERPLMAEEVAEASCINPDATPAFSEDDRFQDPTNNIVEVLGSLVSIVPGNTIRLAHFSVKEYLLSSRLLASRSAEFGVSEVDAHVLCARSCLAYILQENELAFGLCEMPFIAYACTYWSHHAQQVTEDEKRIMPLANIFYHSPLAYENWQSMLAPDLSLPGFGINGPRQKKLPPVSHAAAMGFETIVEALSSQLESETIIITDNWQWTALHLASAYGRQNVVRIILRHAKSSSFINATSPDGTALQIACSKGFPEVVSDLLAHGASIEIADWRGRSPITEAAASGHVGIVMQLLNHTRTSNISQKYQGTALLSAIEAGHASIVEKLLQNGATTETIGSKGLTPLLSAILCDRIDTARSLLIHGANVNFSGPLKSTALHRAVQNGSESAVRLLLQHEANPTLRDSDGKTPFHYACARGDPTIVNQFLHHGCEVSLVDGWGRSPIHYAAWSWSLETMELLLNAGAQIEARTRSRETPLQLASQRGGPGVVEVLLSHGADITTCDKKGRTALHFAAVRANGDVLKVLLRHGADPRVKDHRGWTPLKAFNDYESEATGTGTYRIRRLE